MAISESIRKTRATAAAIAREIGKSATELRKKAKKSAAAAEITVRRELRALDKEISALKRSAMRLRKQAKKEIAIAKRRRAAKRRKK